MCRSGAGQGAVAHTAHAKAVKAEKAAKAEKARAAEKAAARAKAVKAATVLATHARGGREWGTGGAEAAQAPDDPATTEVS